jgi:hypothetical protein
MNKRKRERERKRKRKRKRKKSDTKQGTNLIKTKDFFNSKYLLFNLKN